MYNHMQKSRLFLNFSGYVWPTHPSKGPLNPSRENFSLISNQYVIFIFDLTPQTVLILSLCFQGVWGAQSANQAVAL